MNLLDEIRIARFPDMYAVEQACRSEKVADIELDIKSRLAAAGSCPAIRPGAKVAVAVGSREIKNLLQMLQVLLQWIRERGAEPFIVPAMGSHGGANESGQIELLRGYGITAESLGIPFRSSMAVTQLGTISSGMPVYFSQEALQADTVVLINKVRLHTNFRGPVESGLLKMLVVGLGKHHGALEIHNRGFEAFGQNILAAAELIQQKVHVSLGIGILENADQETARIAVIAGDRLWREEPALLAEARELMARIPFQKVDVLVVREMGKDISGDGMDPNVTGRFSSNLKPDPKTPEIARIAVLDLTALSHGNAVGIGYADVTTRRLTNKIDSVATYTNAVTANAPGACKIPIVMENDRQALELAFKTCGNLDVGQTRVVIIKNTRELRNMRISGALLDEADANPALRVRKNALSLAFDPAGNLQNNF